MATKGLLRPEITLLGDLEPIINLKGSMNIPSVTGRFEKLMAVGYVIFPPIEVSFGTLLGDISLPEEVELFTTRGNITIPIDSWNEGDYDEELPKEYEFIANYTLPNVFKSKPVVKQLIIFDVYWLLKTNEWNDSGIWVDKDKWND